MSYIAFALKYRPKDFSEVIGQAHVVSSLRNAIVSKRVHHAYIFSGPRGVGKTSLARILAKSLNCFEGPTPTPCGKCASCVEISAGRSLDIIEIDGASNRGIDEIRTLRENVKLSAAHSRYKIYIIDEVHMLTQEAFNALLKTLEEPPEHVKFIFATTHPHKILPTILSRCQKFQFNLIPLEQIASKLKKIALAEKIKVKEEFFYTIAKAAAGSIRDAESLFDQLAPVVIEKGDLDDIFSFLGIIDEESLNKMLKSLVEKDLSACLSFINRIVEDGKDLGIFLNAFIEHLRNLLLAKVSIKNFQELSEVSPQSKSFIAALAKNISISGILEVIDLLMEAKDLSRNLSTVRIPFELALIKYSCADKILAEPAPKKAQAVPSAPKKEEAVKKEDNSSDLTKSDLAEIDSFVLEEESEPLVSAAPAEKDGDNVEESVPADDVLLQPVKANWKKILSDIHKTRAALSSHLSFAQPIASQGSRISIAFPPKDSFHKESVEGAKKVEFIEEAISKIIGKKVGIKFVSKELPGQPAPAESTLDTAVNESLAEESGPVSKEDDNFLNELLDTFDGKFHNTDH